jgi:DNA-binding MurR/RpiR family transcriptional regulator
VVAHPAEVWQNYGLGLLLPRSLVLLICGPGKAPEMQEFAAAARERGCTLLALAGSAEHPVASLADHVFLVRAEGDADAPAVPVCFHTALHFLAFEVARALKKPKPYWEAMEREFDELPKQMDWVFTQLAAVVRSAAAEVARLPRLRIVGGGFCQYPAWKAAQRMRSAGFPAEAVEATEFWSGVGHFARRDDTVLFLSGSQAKLKKLVHRCAAQARANGARVLSLTDGNDRDLIAASDLGILLPALLEVPAASLLVFMLEWLAGEVARAAQAGDRVAG